MSSHLSDRCVADFVGYVCVLQLTQQDCFEELCMPLPRNLPLQRWGNGMMQLFRVSEPGLLKITVAASSCYGN